MKIKVGVFFGGSSVEHDVSIITAVQAMENINKDKYEVVPVYIDKERTFYTGNVLREMDTYKDFKAYKKSDMTSMTDAQIISDLSTTSSIPGSELKSYIYYRGPSYSSNTDYVLCSVAYNNNNQQGELQKYEFSTRSSTLPMAEMSSLTSGSSGGKDYWYFTITAKNSATSYYLGYFTDEEDYDLNFWYLPYWLYYKVQDGSYTSADAYDLWGNVQFGRSTSQVSLATWAIVSGKTLGNTSFIQATTSSSARGVPYRTDTSKKVNSAQLSKKEAEMLSKKCKIYRVKGY